MRRVPWWFLASIFLLAGCGTTGPERPNLILDADSLAVEGQQAFSQGRTQRAMDMLRLSLSYNRGTDRVPAVAQNLNDLGVVAMAAGDYPAARRYLEESLRIYEQIKDSPGEMSAKLNLASLRGKEGAQIEALDELNQVLEEAQRRNLPGVAASARNEIAQALVREKKLEEAKTMFEKALGQHRQAGSRLGEGISLHNLADVEIELGMYRQAKEHAEQAVRMDKEGEWWPALGDDLFLIGRAMEGLGEQAGALHHYERAFYVYRFVGETAKMDAAAQAVKKLGAKPPPAESSPDVPTPVTSDTPAQP